MGFRVVAVGGETGRVGTPDRSYDRHREEDVHEVRTTRCWNGGLPKDWMKTRSQLYFSEASDEAFERLVRMEIGCQGVKRCATIFKYHRHFTAHGH